MSLKDALSPGGRIVNVASNYAGGLNLSDYDFVRRQYDETSAYKASKQADRMLTAKAAEEFRALNITVNACHPGVVTSPLLKGLGMSSGFDSSAKAAETPVFLATSDSVSATTGTYFVDQRPTSCAFSQDRAGCNELWALCSRLSGLQ